MIRSVVVAKYVPWPPDSGDKRRTLAIVRALRELGDVTVCAFHNPGQDVSPLVDEGITVRSVPRRRRLSALVVGVVRGRSLTAARFYDPALTAAVTGATRSATDLIVVEHVQLLPHARHATARVRVLDMHNIESALVARYGATRRGVMRVLLSVESRALAALERRAQATHRVVVVSDTDRLRLGGDALVVPNAWDEPTPLPPAPEPTVCFVALLSWAPNVDAAVWFTRVVWPRVRAEVPDARLLLVGRDPTRAVRDLADDSVTVTGTVADLTQTYADTRVAVAPLRAGGGSRLKILEALAHARPVVATSVGAEGLEDLVGRGVLVADSPHDLAARIVDLLRDDDRCRRLGEAGVAAVREDHSWQAAVRPLVDLVTTSAELRVR